MSSVFLISFKSTSLAIIEIMFIGLCGYFFAKKNILSPDVIKAISKLVITLIVPFFIFSRLLKNFSFTAYPNWWIFPILSIIINLAGFILGIIFLKFNKSITEKRDFLSLVTFQNSGYLVLGLAAALFKGQELEQMLVYIFLFLLGFNLLIWSFGVWFLVKKQKARVFEYELLFSPTIIAIAAALLLVLFKWNQFIPNFIIRPIEAIGNTAVVMAMLIIGANLGLIKIKEQIDKRVIFYICLIKLVFLPLIALIFISKISVPRLLGIFMIMECAVPSATTLSIIAHGYKKNTNLIDQGIFWTHLVSLITLPFFLAFTL